MSGWNEVAAAIPPTLDRASAPPGSGAAVNAVWTNHARARRQQRGLPPIVIDWLWHYGREVHDGAGAVTLYFDKRARRALERSVGREVVRRMDGWMDAYLVASTSGQLNTVGHRYARIRH